EAKLPTPPTKVGDKYQGKDWDMTAIQELGMKLTVDKDGNDATSSSFDANNIGQWGFDSQSADTNPLAESALFGAGSRVASNGKITAKLHADTFSLLKGTKNPDAAFKALSVLVDSGALLADYGAFPADPSKQQAFFDTINKQYPDDKIDWSVPQAMLSYPDIPNHQSWVPNYAKAKAALQA